MILAKENSGKTGLFSLCYERISVLEAQFDVK